MIGDEWCVTVEMSRVASACNFAIILSLCLLVITLCSTEDRAGDSFRLAICFLSLISHDSHLVRAALSFAVTPLMLGM